MKGLPLPSHEKVALSVATLSSAVLFGLSSSAQAQLIFVSPMLPMDTPAPINPGDPDPADIAAGIVGTIEGLSDFASETAIVDLGNTLLGLGQGVIEDDLVGVITIPDRFKTNPNVDYTETLDLGVAGALRIEPNNNDLSGTHYTFDNLGYEYAIAKYNGENAGYVMFALSPDSFTNVSIPTESHNIWSPGSGGYQLTNVTLVTPIPEPSPAITLGGLLFLSLRLRERRQP